MEGAFPHIVRSPYPPPPTAYGGHLPLAGEDSHHPLFRSAGTRHRPPDARPAGRGSAVSGQLIRPPQTCVTPAQAGVHRAARGWPEPPAVPLAAEWTPEQVRGDGVCLASLGAPPQRRLRATEARAAGGGGAVPGQLIRPPQTCVTPAQAGVHRAARGWPEPPAVPLAAEWIPDQVRGDGVCLACLGAPPPRRLWTPSGHDARRLTHYSAAPSRSR